MPDKTPTPPLIADTGSQWIIYLHKLLREPEYKWTKIIPEQHTRHPEIQVRAIKKEKLKHYDLPSPIELVKRYTPFYERTKYQMQS